MVEVGRPNLEFEKLDLDEKMLGRIAADTGGRYVHITTADHLVDQLDRTPAEQAGLPRAAAVLAAGCSGWSSSCVLTTEWILRKRFQLR